jgi:hypothetical protein
LSDEHTHRFEEVNNYSRLLTSRFCGWFGEDLPIGLSSH